MESRELHNTCAFTGHRPHKFAFALDEAHPDCFAVKELLKREIQAMAFSGVKYFISGMSWGSDIWAAEIALELRQSQGIRLVCALPHEKQASGWTASYRERYERVLDAADEIVLVSRHYTRQCMMARNRWMIGQAQYLLAVYCGRAGGTRNTIALARKNDRCVVVIDSRDMTVSRSSQFSQSAGQLTFI